MSNFFDEIAAKLATLSGLATPKDSLEQLNEFDVRDIQAVRVSEGGGGGGGNVPFVGVDPPASPTDGMLWWDPDDSAIAVSTQAVGCVLLADSVDLTDLSAAYFTWNAIYDNPYDANTIDALPDGIGLDPNSIGTDTIVTTEAGVWAFTVDRITIPVDATFTGQITFGNMNICPLIDVPLTASGVRAANQNPASVVNLPAGAGFSVGILTVDAATADPFNCSIAGLIIVRLA